MKNKNLMRMVTLLLILLLIIPPCIFAQEAAGKPVFKQEELDQMLAPIALYPDSLLSQILMAATYPLEVVQAQRWVQQNKNLKGDALAKALEAQPWDPSIKSLVNFPQVLDMMNEKLEWTQRLGDAFLAQQEDVMATVQRLRAKAQKEGNLKSSKEQTVKVEKEYIIIESASPQVIYVPTYNPTIVYGTWWYPAYPPPVYYPPPAYYPPGYVATRPAFAFAAGVAVGAAWGYAWGHCNWRGGDVDIDVNRNININNNINRGKYAQQYQGKGQGKWQHNASHRKGVAYRDQSTAQRYNKGLNTNEVKSRNAYRGRTEQGRQDLAKGGADQFRGSKSKGSSVGDRSGGNAFQGMDRGKSVSDFSSRGKSSRQSMTSSGGFGGGSRGGGFGGGSRGGRR